MAIPTFDQMLRPLLDVANADTAWLPTGLALLGGLFLLAASVLLLYESRYNLRFIERHIDFITFLEDSYERKNRS